MTKFRTVSELLENASYGGRRSASSTPAARVDRGGQGPSCRRRSISIKMLMTRTHSLDANANDTAAIGPAAPAAVAAAFSSSCCCFSFSSGPAAHFGQLVLRLAELVLLGHQVLEQALVPARVLVAASEAKKCSPSWRTQSRSGRVVRGYQFAAAADDANWYAVVKTLALQINLLPSGGPTPSAVTNRPPPPAPVCRALPSSVWASPLRRRGRARVRPALAQDPGPRQQPRRPAPRLTHGRGRTQSSRSICFGRPSPGAGHKIWRPPRCLLRPRPRCPSSRPRPRRPPRSRAASRRRLCPGGRGGFFRREREPSHGTSMAPARRELGGLLVPWLP